MSYADKLKDPRWQRKRLEVFRAADWKCEYCGDGANTLHVHHLKYTGEPWEAPMEDLECLCKTHHDQRTDSDFVICFAEVRASAVAEFYAVIDSLRADGKTTPTDRVRMMIKGLLQ